MIYTEKKTEEGFEYTTEDKEVFGTITFTAKKQLKPEECDSIATTLIAHPAKAAEIKGELNMGNGIVVPYMITRPKQWEDLPETRFTYRNRKTGEILDSDKRLAEDEWKLITDRHMKRPIPGVRTK